MLSGDFPREPLPPRAARLRERAPLLERETEAARISAAVVRARAGDGAVVAIEAAPGLGKSRLLELGADEAAARGFQVLRARGTELEGGFVFGVILQLFERALVSAEAAERDRLLTGSARVLGPVLEGDRDVLAEVDPFALLHAVYWLASNLAERTPLALVVDDAHWADPLSLRALAYLAARISDLRLLLIVASRPGEARGGSEPLRELARGPAADALYPKPITVDGVGELVRSSTFETSPAEGFVAACVEVSGGNPLLLGWLLAALGEEGIQPTDAAAAEVRHIGPAPVARYVSGSLARLTPFARAVARAVAVLGEWPDPRIARQLVGVNAGVLAAAAAELEVAGIFGGEALRFAHPLVRTAVYQDAPAAERADGHRTAARLLHGTVAPDRVASHLILAPGAGEPWAVEALRDAADQAFSLGAPDVAMRYLHRALQEPPAPEDRPAVLAQAARAEVAAGVETAIETLDAAIAAAEPGRDRAALLLDLGRALHARGRQEEAAGACDRGARELPDERDPLRRDLETAWATAALWTPAGAATVRERLERLLEPGASAATVGERALLAALAGGEVLSFGNAGRAIELARTAWCDGSFLRDGGDEASVLAIKGALTRAGRLEEGLAVAEALLADARRRGSPLAHATALASRGTALVALGRLLDGQADLEAALDARRFGWELLAPGAMESLSGVLLARGEIDRAAALLEPAPGEAEQLGTSPMRAALIAARGAVALARGDAASAVDAFRAAGEHCTALLGLPNPALLAWRSSLALGLRRLDELGEARRWADEEVELARRWGAARPLGVALRTRAELERGGDGFAWAREAVEVLEGSGAKLELAHALVVAGVALQRAGRSEEARDTLRAGLDHAAACGATVLATHARDELVAAGARPRRERVSGRDALTASELRVAAMAARGLTNREIAEELFVSLKAVSFHLGNSYRKLDITGRGELAGALDHERDGRAS